MKRRLAAIRQAIEREEREMRWLEVAASGGRRLGFEMLVVEAKLKALHRAERDELRATA